MGLERKPAGVELIDLLDRVLDKGIVVDAASRLHLSAANLKKANHMVVAAVETHLHHSGARAVAKLGARSQVQEGRKPKLKLANSRPRR